MQDWSFFNPSDPNAAYLRKNSEITVEASVGGVYAQLGVGGVDVLAPVEGEQGEDRAVGGRGQAAKRLDMWRSDQSYDYWSHKWAVLLWGCTLVFSCKIFRRPSGRVV